jgi:hypothetical protein
MASLQNHRLGVSQQQQQQYCWLASFYSIQPGQVRPNSIKKNNWLCSSFTQQVNSECLTVIHSTLIHSELNLYNLMCCIYKSLVDYLMYLSLWFLFYGLFYILYSNSLISEMYVDTYHSYPNIRWPCFIILNF